MLFVRCALRNFTAPVLGFLILISAFSAVAQAPARRLMSLPSSTESQITLQDSVTERPALSTHVGHVDGTSVLNAMALILKRTPEQEAALTQLLRDQQDPASPSYHQWLTPEQFGSRFGVSDEDLDLIRTWL